jgi:hypothetical protein
MQEPVWFDDGYTVEDAYIARVPRLHGSVTFDFRPLTMTQRAKVAGLVSKADVAGSEVIAAKTIARAVVRWDVEDRDGQVAPITEEWVKRLNPAIQSKLYNVVMSFQGYDAKPDSDAPQQSPVSYDIDEIFGNGSGVQSADEASAKN